MTRRASDSDWGRGSMPSAARSSGVSLNTLTVASGGSS
jgi:hypothetical protein